MIIITMITGNLILGFSIINYNCVLKVAIIRSAFDVHRYLWPSVQAGFSLLMS